MGVPLIAQQWPLCQPPTPQRKIQIQPNLHVHDTYQLSPATPSGLLGSRSEVSEVDAPIAETTTLLPREDLDPPHGSKHPHSHRSRSHSRSRGRGGPVSKAAVAKPPHGSVTTGSTGGALGVPSPFLGSAKRSQQKNLRQAKLPEGQTHKRGD